MAWNMDTPSADTRTIDDPNTLEGYCIFMFEVPHELLYTLLPQENPHLNSRSFLHQFISDKYSDMPGNNSQVYELWMTIQDIIGRASL